MSRYRRILLAAAFSLTGGAALALTTQEVVDTLSAQGYTRVEVKVGPTQTKVEAIRGTEKLEVVYDNATGATLKSETETVRPGEDTSPGVTIRNRNRDFVRGNDDDDNDGVSDDDDDDDGQGRGRGRGRGGDDDGDDNDGDDDNGDDGDDDDHGGGDDHGGDDHGGDDGDDD